MYQQIMLLILLVDQLYLISLFSFFSQLLEVMELIVQVIAQMVLTLSIQSVSVMYLIMNYCHVCFELCPLEARFGVFISCFCIYLLVVDLHNFTFYFRHINDLLFNVQFYWLFTCVCISVSYYSSNYFESNTFKYLLIKELEFQFKTFQRDFMIQLCTLGFGIIF